MTIGASSLFYRHVKKTPLDRYKGPAAPWREILIKDETKQVTHSFKFRGTFRRLLEEKRGATVVTSSTGNHGISMSESARILGLRAHVFVPGHTSASKRQTLFALGAALTLVDGGDDECIEQAKSFAETNGYSYISRVDDPYVVAGHASLFSEASKQSSKRVQTVFVPVGAGGLLTGAVIHYQGSGVRVVGVELAGVPSMKIALETGKRVLLPHSKSFAEEMLIRQAGMLPLRAALSYALLEIVLVTDEQIQQAIRLLWQHHQIRAEGAGAAALAAALSYPAAQRSGRVMVVVSGGNIDDTTFRAIIDSPSSLSIL